jgi:hypothetical protein
MAQPPSNPLSQVTALSQYTIGGGFAQPQNVTEYQMAPYPVSNPVQLVGVDFVNYKIDGTGYVTFSNLPIRSNNNPVSPNTQQPQTITVLPQDTLMFEVSIMTTSAPIQLQAQVLDEANTVFVGPWIGAGTYLTFRALVSSTSSASGILVGKIYIQRG